MARKYSKEERQEALKMAEEIGAAVAGTAGCGDSAGGAGFFTNRRRQ